MKGSVSYLEIGAPKAQISQDFFRQLFDWPFNLTDRAGEGWFQGSIKVGLHGDDTEPQILVFFQIQNMLKAIAKVKALGGQVGEPTSNEPGFGAFCLCSDPQGVPFGLHEL